MVGVITRAAIVLGRNEREERKYCSAAGNRLIFKAYDPTTASLLKAYSTDTTEYYCYNKPTADCRSPEYSYE
jgi:hypothetical protein